MVGLVFGGGGNGRSCCELLGAAGGKVAVAGRFGRLDTAVHTVYRDEPAPITELAPDDWGATLAVDGGMAAQPAGADNWRRAAASR